jgi:hypothetical protein
MDQTTNKWPILKKMILRKHKVRRIKSKDKDHHSLSKEARMLFKICHRKKRKKSSN